MNTIDRSASAHFTQPLEGMRRAVRQTNTAAEKIASGDVSAENIVDTMEARITFKANAQVLKTQDRMLGTLLDTLA